MDESCLPSQKMRKNSLDSLLARRISKNFEKIMAQEMMEKKSKITRTILTTGPE
jgi:hypothetical protein